MGVIRPNKIGMTGSTAIELIEEVHSKWFPHLRSITTWQTDSMRSLDTSMHHCGNRLAPIDPKGEGWINIPGIDVPFHSPLLSAGVDAFRDVLEKCIPNDVDIDRLIHRYVPNLVARPFELTDNFLDAMIEATGHLSLEDFRPNLAKHGRAILIELLAWQFASPVRWIETQEYLNQTVNEPQWSEASKPQTCS